MLINLNTGEGIEKRLLFPDNQPHIQLAPKWTWDKHNIVVCSMVDSKRVLELLMVASALEEHGLYVSDLHIPYLMAARFDRIMEFRDSFDLKVISRIINSINADRVHLYDPHSDVAPALINKAFIHTNEPLVKMYDENNAILIIPDAGAAKKAHKYMEWNKGITESIQCVKHRDLSTGALTLKVLEPEKCTARHCVIIDDLCDGGGTFLQIAQQIDPVTLTLIVTHGIFSKGFSELHKHFDKIIVSDSYRAAYDSDKTQIYHWKF
jgi:ribose-phosphate pyrophosphokinase